MAQSESVESVSVPADSRSYASLMYRQWVKACTQTWASHCQWKPRVIFSLLMSLFALSQKRVVHVSGESWLLEAGLFQHLHNLISCCSRSKVRMENGTTRASIVWSAGGRLCNNEELGFRCGNKWWGCWMNISASHHSLCTPSGTSCVAAKPW